MTQYIDKSALVAEIESLRHPTFTNFDEGVNAAVQTLLEVLDTLKVKELENFIWNNARTTIPEDSTNQIICIKEDGLAVSTIGKIVNGTVKWAYLNDLLNTNSFNVEAKEVDLDREIEKEIETRWRGEYLFITKFKESAKHFFELGLKAKGE